MRTGTAIARSNVLMRKWAIAIYLCLTSLNHPHICTLYDIGNQDGIDFLVMEYLEDDMLAQRRENGAAAAGLGALRKRLPVIAAKTETGRQTRRSGSKQE